MGKITLTITPSGTGVYTKYASVYTNDPRLGEFRLTVKFEPFVPKGYRVGSYLFDPTNEITATIATGKMYEGQVSIYFSSDRVVEIKNTVADNPAFTVKVETVEPGRRFNLSVKSADKLSAGAHKLLVKLMTDDPNQETLEVTFLVKVGSVTEANAPVKSSLPAKSVGKKSPVKSGAKSGAKVKRN